jgi:hypothetical protein
MNITFFLELKLQLEKSNLDLILAQDKVKKLEEQLAGKLHVIEQYKRQANKLNDVNMQLLDDKASCGVCLDFYDSNQHTKRPVCFPCGHGLCVSCAKTILHQALPGCHMCKRMVYKFIFNFDLENNL